MSVIARSGLLRWDVLRVSHGHTPRQSPRLLRRRRPGHRDRRACARALRRPHLRPPRGGPQPLRRGEPQAPGRRLRRRAGAGPGGGHRHLQRPRGRPAGPRGGRGPQSAGLRRHLPPGHQGAPGGRPPLQGRLRGGPHRSPGPPRGGGHHGPVPGRRGAVHLVESVADVASLAVGTRSRLAYVTQTTLSVDDTAEIIAALQGPLPQAIEGPRKRHLLRHPEPPGRGQGARPPLRPGAGGGFAQQLQLQPPAGARREAGCPAT
jgi:hypothetical protein